MQANGKSNGEQIPQQIIVREVQAAPVAAEVDVLAIIEKRNAMLSRILDYAISSTHAGQWTDQNGKPYPTAPAAEVMARRCAVRIEHVHSEKVPSSDDKGPFYMYIVTCTASLPGGYDSIQAMGTCSSRDTFLGTETRSGRLLSEVDEGNILKAAYSNMLVNAITRLLGVRNLTWEQLAQHGIHREGAAKVEYHGGSRGGGASANASGPTVKFGKDKGKTLPELDDQALAFHLKAALESVAKNDPKWHAKNQEWLAHVQAEKKRREGAAKETRAQTAERQNAAGGAWEAITKLWPRSSMKWEAFTSLVRDAVGGKPKDALDENDVELVRAALSEPGQDAAPEVG